MTPWKHRPHPGQARALTLGTQSRGVSTQATGPCFVLSPYSLGRENQ